MSATKALECCKQPPYTDFASRDAVAKPRLDGTPPPRSLGGSDDEAAGTIWVTARAPPIGRLGNWSSACRTTRFTQPIDPSGGSTCPTKVFITTCCPTTRWLRGTSCARPLASILSRRVATRVKHNERRARLDHRAAACGR